MWFITNEPIPSIPPSIFYTCLIQLWGAGAYPSGHGARGGVHPGQVASPSQHLVNQAIFDTFIQSFVNVLLWVNNS